ncbi:hypothetical protein SAMN04515647_3704 [Cohaesibacter sp. ES.047]|uniref:hypothetical protein n=1 Tax=Cohaesibacter sp. ES.047 TaxID=1798205 RepID=UPI000BB88D2C|nr:hypothetical protein [Cohaesibacter sp. ES.047]SNY93409.1 hypothetical protein SAMN04515647_3704 [Cohaesibacter sp. ES.047]
MTRPIAIDKLIEWAYAIEMAHMAEVTGAHWSTPSGCGSNWNAFANLAALGCMVSSGGGTPDNQMLGWEVHPDAAAVHAEVLDLPDRRAIELVMMHGILRNHPDPLADEYVYIDPRAAKGKIRIKMVYANPVRSADPIACVIPWLGGDFDLITEARVDFALWRTSIDLVYERLAKTDVLNTYQPTPCTLPAEPWNGIDRTGTNNPDMWLVAENRHSSVSY